MSDMRPASFARRQDELDGGRNFQSAIDVDMDTQVRADLAYERFVGLVRAGFSQEQAMAVLCAPVSRTLW